MSAKYKILISILCLFIVALCCGTTYSTWAFINVANNDNIITFHVPDWHFSESVISEGQVIVVDDDGVMTIDGEVVESGELENPGDNKSFDNGTVNISVELNDDGELVLTEFTTTPTSTISALFYGSVIYLPSGVSVDGTTYPITGIDQPLNISVSSILGYNTSVTVNIPDSYTYICGEAFASITGTATFNMPKSIISIGSGAFNPTGNRTTQTINYTGTQAEWNSIQKASDWHTGRGKIKVVCSDGTINY